MKTKEILSRAARCGLEINHSRFCGNTTAYLAGCDEVMQGWESLSELLAWAFFKSNNPAFLDLADEAETLELLELYQTN